MALKVTGGYSKNALPYARFGTGPRDLVIFLPINFKHDPPSGLYLRMIVGAFGCLADDHTVYLLNRKRGLPTGYSVRQMSEDYATMIRDELAPPVDVMGVSSGGSMAQHVAADHPDLVRRLVLAATAHRQSEEGNRVGMRVRDLSLQGKWRGASAVAAGAMTPKPAKGFLLRLLSWIFPTMYSPAGPSDGIVEIEAQRAHDFKERLPDIRVPTLVVGGDSDLYFPAMLMRETAAAIPDARLLLHEGLGHEAAISKRLAKDVLSFLAEPPPK